jgi:cysteine sulfinate desulfinase/cysteine desulfurase-like protein
MSFVANGLDLDAGSEILTTNHEHVGGLSCGQLAAARRKLILRQLPLPVPPESPEQVVDLFRRAIGPRTRVISVSHVNFTNGLLMPVREIVALARTRDIITVVDGAHPPGMFRFDLAALDPDFYALHPRGPAFCGCAANGARASGPRSLLAAGTMRHSEHTASITSAHSTNRGWPAWTRHCVFMKRLAPIALRRASGSCAPACSTG